MITKKKIKAGRLKLSRDSNFSLSKVLAGDGTEKDLSKFGGLEGNFADLGRINGSGSEAVVMTLTGKIAIIMCWI